MGDGKDLQYWSQITHQVFLPHCQIANQWVRNKLPVITSPSTISGTQNTQQVQT